MTPAGTGVGAGTIPSLPVGNEIDHLQVNWRQMIKDAPGGLSRTNAAALLRSATPVSIDENVLVLSFKFQVHKDNLEKLDNLKMAEKIVSHCMGRACLIRCVSEPDSANHLVRAAQKLGAQILDVEEK